ncbi:MAG: phenylalanine--tRNA ligase subunit alpha [Armatimonadota bacterium]
MLQELDKVLNQAKEELDKIASLEELENARVKYLGKKGALTQFLKSLGKASPEERPALGQKCNTVKDIITGIIEEKKDVLVKDQINEKIKKESVDITFPARTVSPGSAHPLTIISRELARIFIGLGFSIEDGPELEEDYYNFEALNIPSDHPSRDMWDSFYVKEGLLFRSHTSPVQIRVMEKNKPPLRVISYGRCYRRDAVDATHSWMFNQLEGFMVDENVTFADLKGVLNLVAQKLFGQARRTKFLPGYFPFTEPSAEVYIDCFKCEGKGCGFCKESGWIEILGCGMIHPKVLKNAGYDPEKYTGFAFGMGIERIAMLKYGIDDIRLFFENDKRFLEQFK